MCGLLAHHVPDQPAAVVLDHRQDRALVDAEIVAVEPAAAGHDGGRACSGTLGGKLGLNESRKPYWP